MGGRWDPVWFRGALLAVPAGARDGWVDCVLGLEVIPEDGPELPRGCVPYLPAPVDALLRLSEQAAVGARDRFVDIGCGPGRAAVLVHLLTGAPAVGIEVQPGLVAVGRALVARLGLAAVSFVAGDAVEQTAALAEGSLFFLYCPFSGERLARVLATLEAVAARRPIHVGCLDLPLPPCPWLEPVPPFSVDLAIYRSRPPTLAPLPEPPPSGAGG